MKLLYYSILMLLRGRGNNVTKLISLTLGLFMSILLFACVAFQLSYNHSFRQSNQLYLAYKNHATAGMQEYVYGPFAEALRENFPDQVEDATVMRRMEDWNFYHGNVRLSGLTVFGDTHLFSTLGIPVLTGNTEELKTPDALFISRMLADKLREGAPLNTVIGKVLYLNHKTPYIVRGVFQNQPENTDFPFDAVVPMAELWNEQRAGWGFDISYTVIARFRHPEQDVHVVETRLPELMKKYMPDFGQDAGGEKAFVFRSLADYHTGNSTVRTMILATTLLAIVILLVSAFNYVLISVSSLSHRAKEMGVHKCSGASAGTVFGMFLTETALMVLLSIAGVGLLMYLFADFVEEMAAVRLASLFAIQTLWMPFLVVLLVFLLAGIMPACLFSSIPVTQVFRRYTEHNASWKRPLLFIQFLGVAFAFCFLLVVFRQYQSVVDRPLGYNPERVAICWAKLGGSYENRLSFFKELPMVEDYTCSSQLVCQGYCGETFRTGEGVEVTARMDWVSPNFFPMMQVDIVEGRNFTPKKRSSNFASENHELIVNRTFVRQAGWEGSAVGRVINHEGESLTVVGIMEDYPVYSAYKEQTPVLVGWKEKLGYAHYVRLKEPFEENLATLNRTALEAFPTEEVEFVSLEKTLDEEYVNVYRFRNAVFLTSISIFFIALMGLFGYINDEICRRSKEIAIRKVNGAKSSDIIGLLTREVAWIALPAVFLGSFAAFVLGHCWLEIFAEKITVDAGLHVGVAILILTVIAVCIVWRTWRIADENPVNSIKSE
ncbi:ABC transporter permease [uncultured Bacteroides sp.]|uniref:ABC transporter permease n=1 Tax=uncultured Bacteroides sp. TaxID=162156 RepID=UPI0025951C58|nr:ABC transporter permease [uncultured Bacteroides sp.]